MTSDEILTHALEFETLRRGLDDGSPQGHEDGGIATCRQVQKAAERVQALGRHFAGASGMANRVRTWSSICCCWRLWLWRAPECFSTRAAA